MGLLVSILKTSAPTLACARTRVAKSTSVRRHAFLPFLYDEAGARLREKNPQFLAPPAG